MTVAGETNLWIFFTVKHWLTCELQLSVDSDLAAVWLWQTVYETSSSHAIHSLLSQVSDSMIVTYMLIVEYRPVLAYTVNVICIYLFIKITSYWYLT